MGTQKALSFGAFVLLLLFSITAFCGGEVYCAVDASKPTRLVATDFPNLQAAVDALPNKRGEIYLPPGTYSLGKTLDLTQKPNGGGGTVLTGAGPATIITGATKGQPLLDLTGASSCTLQSLQITSTMTPTDAPNVGVLLARNGAGSAQENRFLNVHFHGYCTVANVYNLSSELDRFSNCTFTNWAPGADNLVYCQENFADVRSPYVGKIVGNSTTEMRVEGCIFYDYGGKGAALPGLHEMLAGGANVRIQGNASDVTVRDSYISPPVGGHAVWLGRASWGAQPQRVFLDGLRIEGDNGDKSPQSIFEVAPWILPGAKPPFGAVVNGKPNALSAQASTLVIRNCAVYAGPGTVSLNAGSAHYLDVENNDFFAHPGKPIIVCDALYYSYIERNRFNFGGNEDVAVPKDSIIVQGTGSIGCDIQVPSRSQVILKKLSGTVIDALNEGGRRKRYLFDVAEEKEPAAQAAG
jgi:hypothetical protein